jgi:hypothetical protein
MEVLSGIPQGSVLGPLLFLIYINDLPDVIKGFVKLFADDTKLYGPMRAPSDRDVMNSNIQSMYDWSCDWQLGFNFKKCKRIHMGHSNPHNSYTIDTVTIEESDCERDLGIMVDHKLSFDQHISTIVNKANRLLGQIKRSFVSRNRKVLMPIYKNIIRPMVEYGSTIWSPWKRKNIDFIEGVQRRFTKLIDKMKDHSYETRLARLDITSLEDRRRREQLIQVYKILNGHYDMAPETILHRSSVHKTREHSFKLTKATTSLNVRKFYFSNNIINDWNDLSEHIVSATSLNQFKGKLERHMKTTRSSEWNK